MCEQSVYSLFKMQQRRFILLACVTLVAVALGALLTWVIIPPTISYMVDQVNLIHNRNK